MTAKVTRLAPPARPVDIVSHLAGTGIRHAEVMKRMMGQDAVRHFVRAIASKNPLSDSNNRADIWAQVEDVTAHLPSLASSTVELEIYVNALRRVLSAVQSGLLAIAEGDIKAGHLRVTAYKRRLRVSIGTRATHRVVDFRLETNGAVRIGDQTTGG